MTLKFISYNSESSSNQKRKSEDQNVRPGALPGGFRPTFVPIIFEHLTVGETIRRDYHSYQKTKTESQMHQPSSHTRDLCFLCANNDQMLRVMTVNKEDCFNRQPHKYK